MKLLFGAQDIVTRSRELSRTNLLFIFGLIKAASIGIAVTVFLQIFIDLGPIWSWLKIIEHLPLFLLWSVSYFCLLVTYDSAVFATIFLIHIPKKSETFFTFLLVGSEALQFAILSPSLNNELNHGFILSVAIQDWWFIIFAFYCLFIFCLIYFAHIELNSSKVEFSEELLSIVDIYIRSFKKAKLIILTSLCIAILVFCMLLSFENQIIVYIIRFVASLLFFSINSIAFFIQHKQRLEIENQFKKYKLNI